VILSVVLVTTTDIISMLFKKDKSSYDITLSKIDFESTRLFLDRRIFEDNNLELLQYNDNILYYDSGILLKDVIVFNKDINNGIITIKICIKNSYKICQDMVFKIPNN